MHDVAQRFASEAPDRALVGLVEAAESLQRQVVTSPIEWILVADGPGGGVGDRAAPAASGGIGHGSVGRGRRAFDRRLEQCLEDRTPGGIAAVDQRAYS